MSVQRLPFVVAGFVACLLWSHPAAAQQWISLNVGAFAPRGADARIDDDVLLENAALFDVRPRDFRDITVGGEWHAGFGRFFEAGVGLDYFRSRADSVYLDYVDDDGYEIEQEFYLRVVPLTFTLRVHPLGRDAVLQPYFGGGVGVYNWRYSETGDFIDFTTFDVFNDRFSATGTDIGGLVLGGVRVPLGTDFGAGIEVRYRYAAGTVGVDNGFLADRIDLGGLATRVSLQFRF